MTIVRIAGHKLPWRPIVFAFAQNGNNEWWGWNTRVCGCRCMSHAWRRTHSATDSSTGCGDHTQGRRCVDAHDDDAFEPTFGRTFKASIWDQVQEIRESGPWTPEWNGDQLSSTQQSLGEAQWVFWSHQQTGRKAGRWKMWMSFIFDLALSLWRLIVS